VSSLQGRRVVVTGAAQGVGRGIAALLAGCGAQVAMLDVNAEGLAQAVVSLERDLVVFVDVGGDVLAQGDEPGLRSPLCDAVMLAAAWLLGRAGCPVLVAIFGIGCDGELTTDEVLSRLADVASVGGFCGARGLTGSVADRLEGAIAVVPTEASAHAVRTFRGASGPATIRGGQRTFELSSLAGLTLYLDVEPTVRACGKLARAVASASSLEDANEALNRLGVHTELDLEREAAEASGAA